MEVFPLQRECQCFSFCRYSLNGHVIDIWANLTLACLLQVFCSYLLEAPTHKTERNLTYSWEISEGKSN